MKVNRRLPQGGLAGFPLFAGIALLFGWGIEIVEGIVSGSAPTLIQSYHTLATHVLDLSVITPALFLTGALLLKGGRMGYPLASIFLISQPLGCFEPQRW